MILTVFRSAGLSRKRPDGLHDEDTCAEAGGNTLSAGGCGGKRIAIYGKAFTCALFLDALKFSQNFQALSRQSNGRCSWDVFMNMPCLSFVYAHIVRCAPISRQAYHINHRRGFLRCSFDSTGQCEKPQSVGRVTSTDFHAFFVYMPHSGFIV